MASFFGGFQMLMPAIGWLVGLSFKEIVMGVDHWIAFGLLAFIGSKMIYDLTKKEKENKEETLKLQSLLTLAVANSIDALMVGLSFAFLQTSMLEPILVIGLITFFSFTIRLLFRLWSRSRFRKQGQNRGRAHTDSHRNTNPYRTFVLKTTDPPSS
jgi:putative Mn2+ efflux pump MntP